MLFGSFEQPNGTDINEHSEFARFKMNFVHLLN